MTREELIDEIVERRERIIPIIGDDAFVCNWEGGQNQPLPVYILTRLKEKNKNYKIKKKIDSSEYYHCITKLILDGIDEKRIVKDIIEIVSNGLGRNEIRLNEIVLNFLKVGKFSTIITTNCFNLFKKTNILPSYDNIPFIPADQKIDKKDNTDLRIFKEKVIYHIFGTSDNNLWVYHEPSLLFFLHELQEGATENGHGASLLVKLIQKISEPLLLPIGCGNLPNWIFRFLWYPISPLGLNKKSGHNGGGLWCSEIKDELETFLYTESFSYANDNDLNENSILEELSDKLNNKNGEIANRLNVEWNDEGRWDYFLSYSTDINTGDIPGSVISLYNWLKGKDKTVWMDSRNLGVDNYWDAISYGIKNSDRIILCLTDSYLEKLRQKYPQGERKPHGVYTELDKINDIIKSSPKKIVPIVVKGTCYREGNDLKEITNGKIVENLPFHEDYRMAIDRFYQIFDQKNVYFFDENVAEVLNPIGI